MLSRPMNKPNSCDSIKTIGGNANVVKKAVAPAIRIGSFFPSNANECRRLVNNSVNSLPFVLFSVMIQTKIKRCFSSVLSSFRGLQTICSEGVLGQMFRSKTKDPDIPGLPLVFSAPHGGLARTIRNPAAIHFITFAVTEWIDVFTRKG